MKATAWVIGLVVVMTVGAAAQAEEVFVPILPNVSFTTSGTGHGNVEYSDDAEIRIVGGASADEATDGQVSIVAGSSVTIGTTNAIPYGTPVVLHITIGVAGEYASCAVIENGQLVFGASSPPNSQSSTDVATFAGATFMVSGHAEASGMLPQGAGFNVDLQASADLHRAFAMEVEAPGVCCGPDPLLLQMTIAAPIGTTIDPATCLLHYTDGGTWQSKPMIWDGADTFQVALVPPSCGESIEYYLEAQNTMGGYFQHPMVGPLAPLTLQCGDGRVMLLQEPLDSDPGWVTEGQWAFGVPQGFAGDPTSGYTGSNVYGYNLSGGNLEGWPWKGVIAGPIDTTGQHDLRLTHWSWLTGPEYQSDMDAMVGVSVDGVNWTMVWRRPYGQLHSGWNRVGHDISILDDEPAAYVCWSMRVPPEYAPIWGGGWNIDDIEITAVDCSQNCATFWQPGDMDCDGDCDFDDISLFVTAIGDTGPAWAAHFQALFGTPPTCSMLNGDFDFDGDIDFDDIAPFVDAIGS
jgi:hypothetical protein